MTLYLKPLRRKLGIATLVLACLLVAGWVRSFGRFDSIVIPLGSVYCLNFESTQGAFLWSVSAHDESRNLEWSSSALSELQLAEKYLEDAGISNSTFHQEISSVKSDGFSYRSVTAFFTLLSAYLLLRKPRAGKVPEKQP